MKKLMYKQNPRIKQIVNNEEPTAEKKVGVKKDPPKGPRNQVVAENRIGFYHISGSLIDNLPWKVYQKLSRHFAVVSCKLVPKTQIFEVLAYSPLFGEVSKLEKNFPTYQIDVKGDREGHVTVTAKKIEKSKIITLDNLAAKIKIRP